MKQNEAAAFVDTIKGPQWGGEESTVAVNVDPGMLAAMQRATLISPAWLAACTATMGASLNSMAVLAANNNTMQVGPDAHSMRRQRNSFESSMQPTSLRQLEASVKFASG